jgi:hypothetical protein
VSFVLMRRDPDGVLTRCTELDSSLLREQLDEAGRTCRSGELADVVRWCLPDGYQARMLEPMVEVPPDLVEPFMVEQPGFAGEAGAWHPDRIGYFVRADGGKVTSYFSESSYWPALLDGVGGLLGHGASAGERAPVRQVVYGLHPCARPESSTGRFRRLAFSQAHIDVMGTAGEPALGLCLDALASMHRLVCQVTGVPAESVRARVADSRAWTGLLASYARPQVVQDLRSGFLNPAAAGVALDGADPAVLARGVRSALDRAGLAGLPEPVVEVIEHRIRTGQYEPDRGDEPSGEQARALAGLCADAGIAAVVDARSARRGYSGLIWQIDCRSPGGGWVEVAGGGDYTDAAGLLSWLGLCGSTPAPVRVAGSAVGIERALAVAAG